MDKELNYTSLKISKMERKLEICHPHEDPKMQPAVYLTETTPDSFSKDIGYNNYSGDSPEMVTVYNNRGDPPKNLRAAKAIETKERSLPLEFTDEYRDEEREEVMEVGYNPRSQTVDRGRIFREGKRLEKSEEGEEN